MFDIDAIIKKYISEDGSIPSDAVAKLEQAVNSSVGREFVAKERYTEKLEEIETLKTEKQTAEDSATTAGKWKDKYDVLKGEFDTYKSEQASKETKAAKEKAYRALLQEAGVSEKRLESVLKVSDVDSVELDDKGAIKGADKLTESIKSEWADFITTTQTRGAQTSNPPANNGVKMTKDEIFKIKDPVERQNAIAENIGLFNNQRKE